MDESNDELIQRLKRTPYKLLDTKQTKTDLLFKLILVGDSAVGKSALMNRVTTNDFTQDHEVTVGVEFGSLVIEYEHNLFKVQVWDTAGQENFKSVTKVFYRGAHVVFLTFDLTRADTFYNLEKWFDEVRNQVSDSVIVLVGNMKDKNQKLREVTEHQAQEFREKHGIKWYVETSAKTGENVELLFMMGFKFVHEKFKDKIGLL